MVQMVRTLTILLLLAASGLNTATASSAFCSDLPISPSLSSEVSPNTEITDLSLTKSTHDDSSDHSNSSTHHCHLGHCQYLVSTNDKVLSPDLIVQSLFSDVEQLAGVANREFHRPPCS